MLKKKRVAKGFFDPKAGDCRLASFLKSKGIYSLILREYMAYNQKKSVYHNGRFRNIYTHELKQYKFFQHMNGTYKNFKTLLIMQSYNRNFFSKAFITKKCVVPVDEQERYLFWHNLEREWIDYK